MNFASTSHRVEDPDYFSLTVRQALRDGEPEIEPDEASAGMADPETEELLTGEYVALADHPEAVEVGVRIADAEAAVLAAEDAGVPDELAMRRLDKARAEERAVLAQLQKARTVAHTVRAESRAAQVGALRPRLTVIRGGEAGVVPAAEGAIA